MVETKKVRKFVNALADERACFRKVKWRARERETEGPRGQETTISLDAYFWQANSSTTEKRSPTDLVHHRIWRFQGKQPAAGRTSGEWKVPWFEKVPAVLLDSLGTCRPSTTRRFTCAVF